MKFPLPEHPFRPVRLSPEQCREYEHVNHLILRDTITEYERFVHLENRMVDKKQWKAVKTRENLTVFKQVGGRAAVVQLASTPASPASATLAHNMHEWKLPKLLAVGNIAGTLDDVMYGVVAPDVKSMLLRSSYVNDELVDGGVLCQIKAATAEDPFQFLGIKWLVKAHPSALNAVVSPRDTVVIDGTGLHVQENGDRIGYHVMHSVLLPECPELTRYSIMRGYLSSCYLFKQMRNGTVEVYMKTYVEPGGRLSESLATLSVANALIGCWKSVWCAQGKKLTWLIKSGVRDRMRQRRQRGEASSSIEPTASSTALGKKLSCELCRDAFRAYKSAQGCQVCLKIVCSKCQITRKISHMQRGLQVKQMAVIGCKDCVAHAAQLSALEVARDEFVGKQVQQHSLMTDGHSSSDEGDSWTASGVTLLEGYTPKPMEMSSAYEDPERTPSPTAIQLTAPQGCIAPPPEYGMDEHRQHLWMQMTQLRIAAEQTYKITKQNEAALRFAPVD